MPHAEDLLFPLSIVALVVAAMTAALAAGRRSMDWMGVAMLSSITALGGDVNPSGWFAGAFIQRSW